jgi:1,4-alpha-glucan branching enzyme
MVYLNFSRQEGQWIPNEYGGNENLAAVAFLREMNEIVHRESPGAVTIAEESTAWPMVSRPTYLGGLGFTFKWNMGWMHDTLKYISKDPVYRRFEHNQLTFSLLYAFTENFVLSLSHDEVVHMKGSLIYKIAGDWWQKFATLRLLFGYQYTHPGKKLNFMGQEFGQWSEWSEERALDWYLTDWPTHAHMSAWTRDLNRFYREQPALYQQDYDWKGFRWINANDADQSALSYIRYADDPKNFVVVVLNFTPVPRHNYVIGVPAEGYYAELLNSDSAYYGGGNIGNVGGVHSYSPGWGDFPYALSLTLPPLAIVVLKLQPGGEPK